MAQAVNLIPAISRAVLLLILLSFLGVVVEAQQQLSQSSVSRDLHAVAAGNDGPNKRQDSDTNYCKRWSHQSALVNATLYAYGGRVTTSAEQTSNQWSNDFLILDLTKEWQISEPAMTGLAHPSGPPAVANGYLWSSYDALYLYGGEFSDDPVTSPAPNSMWAYDIASKDWRQSESPTTASGTNAPDDGDPVERAAEGAGFSFAGIGRGWYFGGHEDGYTVEGWSQSVARIYLTSLLEFTFPGYPNSEVKSLSGGATAGDAGVWRNITQGALATDAGFPERADGVLVYIPGFGDDGILVGLAGGNNDTFTQTNIIDIYDVATSTWYKQATSGSTPQPRVNPCAVVAAAADGSSYQIYMFAGQDLQPAGAQTQYNDMWILSVPSFTWMQVDTSSQSVPPGRSGHTCNIWDAQMIVVGGYVADLSCEYPGVYSFNTSSLQWSTRFTPMSDAQTNPQSQQLSQLGKSTGMQGSYGYEVPNLVLSAIGGGPSGGATVTLPAATATAGPLATGTANSYPLPTGTTGGADSNSGTGSSGSTGSTDGGSSTNVGAIVAGVVAGVAVVAAIYLALVAYIYRKRMRQYKRNVDRFGWRPAKEGLVTNQEHNGRGRRGYAPVGFHTRRDSSTDLLGNQEPSFVGIMLHPRRSLRVTNPD